MSTAKNTLQLKKAFSIDLEHVTWLIFNVLHPVSKILHMVLSFFFFSSIFSSSVSGEINFY